MFCRLAALEKVGIISEEEQASQSALSEALNGLELFRTAIELQVDKIEKRIAVAETLTQQLRQTASSGDQKSLQAAEARLEAKYQQHSQDLASLGFKLEEFEVSTLQARKVSMIFPRLLPTHLFAVINAGLSRQSTSHPPKTTVALHISLSYHGPNPQQTSRFSC